MKILRQRYVGILNIGGAFWWLFCCWFCSVSAWGMQERARKLFDIKSFKQLLDLHISLKRGNQLSVFVIKRLVR